MTECKRSRHEHEYSASRTAAGVDSVDVTSTRYNGAVHGFFQMSNFSRLGKNAVAQCSRFLAETSRLKD